jgi:hypothetical protein
VGAGYPTCRFCIWDLGLQPLATNHSHSSLPLTGCPILSRFLRKGGLLRSKATQSLLFFFPSHHPAGCPTCRFCMWDLGLQPLATNHSSLRLGFSGVASHHAFRQGVRPATTYDRSCMALTVPLVVCQDLRIISYDRPSAAEVQSHEDW